MFFLLIFNQKIKAHYCEIKASLLKAAFKQISRNKHFVSLILLSERLWLNDQFIYQVIPNSYLI